MTGSSYCCCPFSVELTYKPTSKERRPSPLFKSPSKPTTPHSLSPSYSVWFFTVLFLSIYCFDKVYYYYYYYYQLLRLGCQVRSLAGLYQRPCPKMGHIASIHSTSRAGFGSSHCDIPVYIKLPASRYIKLPSTTLYHNDGSQTV